MRDFIRDWYPKESTDTKKFRPGACENCGAMGHKKRDCFERPRARNAKQTESNFAPDDHVVSEEKLDYAAKRDRWSNFDPVDYDRVVEEHEQLEETRKLIKAKNVSLKLGLIILIFNRLDRARLGS
jgi:pre-mRNA-processing factor SLU7